MVSFLWLRWARSYARTELWALGLPSCLAARYSNVANIAQAIGCSFRTVHPFEGGMLTICSA